MNPGSIVIDASLASRVGGPFPPVALKYSEYHELFNFIADRKTNIFTVGRSNPQLPPFMLGTDKTALEQCRKIVEEQEATVVAPLNWFENNR